MTTVRISVVDVGGKPSRGDFVTVWSPVLRGSGEQLISSSPVLVPLTKGVGQVDLRPGMAHIRFHCRDLQGEYVVTVPEGGAVNLGNILGGVND